MTDIEKFNKFEDENNLFSRKYNGLYYWQWIRVHIGWMCLYFDQCSQNKKKVTKLFFERVKLLFITLIGAIFDSISFLFLKHSDILYISENIGLKIDRFWDYFNFEKKWSCQKLNSRSNKLCNKMNMDRIPEISFLLHKFILNHYCRNEAEECFVFEILKQLEDLFKCELNANAIVFDIVKKCARYNYYYNFYYKLLNRIKPKVIFFVEYYRYDYFVLFDVARKLNIPTIEFQHGLIVNHYAYSFPDNVSTNVSLPDYLFVWGKRWKELIKMPTCDKIIITGNPYIEYMVSSNREVDHTNTIAFFSEDMGGTAYFINLIRNFIKLDIEKKWRIIIKPHPNEDIELFKVFDKKENVVIVDKHRDVYHCLANSSVHVVLSSTVLFESLFYPAKRIVYKAHQRYKKLELLINEGYADIVNDANELYSLIQKDYVCKNCNVCDYFARNSANKSNIAMNKIINKKI